MSKNSTFEKFISKESLSGIILFIATIFAVSVANSNYSQIYHDFWLNNLGITFGDKNISMSLKMWIDDGLMAIFFLMVGLEIKREMSVGELSTLSKASFPIIAAIGGMVVPALIYVSFNQNNPLGFGIPMATDIAFALGILMLLGKKVNPALKLFLVALAVVDDLGAVLVVATVYTNEIKALYFIHAILIYASIWALNYFGVKKILPYLILGIFLWIYIHEIGIHATIAGVLLAFAIPIKSKIKETNFINSCKESVEIFEKNIDTIPILNHNQIEALEEISEGYNQVQNPLVKLEHNLHSLSAFLIMPIFAFSNAGVMIDFSTVNEHFLIVLGVFFGLVLGKPIGILGFTYLATKLKIVDKPENISWYEIVAVGFLGGIGFTMSIFVTHLAFIDESIISAVKLSILSASTISAIIGTIFIIAKK